MTIQPAVLTVTQLNRKVRNWLEDEMGDISVEGEISNLSKPSSGHFYFTLKDATAQLRCVYFRNRNLNNLALLQNGQQIIAFGRLSLYEARGDYQLIVEHIKEAGQGDLHRQFEQLKVKLHNIGLFETLRKKPLPFFPRAIGVISSASGAALRDVLATLKRRFPIVPIIVYACEVQGKQASQQLIHAIKRANHDKRCDVIILARGGGSIEDLWAFNDEELAHTIARSTLPIISGIGHETDFTIADFVADFRAATPTAAAEAAAPNVSDLLLLIENLENRLTGAITRLIKHKFLLLHHEMEKIGSPGKLIFSKWQMLDYLKSHLLRALKEPLIRKHHHLHLLHTRLQAKNPALLTKDALSRLHHFESLLSQQMEKMIRCAQQRLTPLMVTLHAVSPLSTLERGYSITTIHHKILLSSQQVELDDIIDIRLFQGKLIGKIIHKEEE